MIVLSKSKSVTEVSQKRLFLLLESLIVFSNEVVDLRGHAQELFPLLSIQRDRETSEPVDGEHTFSLTFKDICPRVAFFNASFSAKAINLCLQFFFPCHQLK